MRLIREKGVWRWGKREIIYLSLHCHHLNDSSIKMGSDESHFNVSFIVRDKVTRQCPQTTTFEEKGEPKRYRIEVLPLTSLPLTARPNQLSQLNDVDVDHRLYSAVFRSRAESLRSCCICSECVTVAFYISF